MRHLYFSICLNIYLYYIYYIYVIYFLTLNITFFIFTQMSYFYVRKALLF